MCNLEQFKRSWGIELLYPMYTLYHVLLSRLLTHCSLLLISDYIMIIVDSNVFSSAFLSGFG